MQMFNIPVHDGRFYLKLVGGMLISGPVSLVSKSQVLNSVLLTEKELKQWFLKAAEVSFPFFSKEQVFVIQPPQVDEREGEYIVLDYTQERYGLAVKLRVRIEPTGHDAVTLSPEVLDELLEKAITSHVNVLYS